ncbi:hypothetical protein [Albimonas pacifica]|nr:hypothetical protein [Albimonas pacifica]
MTRKRLHPKDLFTSQSPEARAWRAKQAEVDSEIEGLPRDPEAAALAAQMERDGVPDEEQIARLIAYFKMRSGNSSLE